MLPGVEIKKLAAIHSNVCVSIYLPTHRRGKEVLEAQDRLVLKNEIQNVGQKLPSFGLAPSEVNAFLEPLVRLLDDDEFWHHQSDGLAIFRSNGLFKKYSLPIHFKERFEISSEFYLLPLLPYLMDERQYLLLGISLRGADLYLGSKFEFDKVTPASLTSLEFEEDSDREFRSGDLQIRTHATKNYRSGTHGHKEVGQHRKELITRNFRKIDQIVTSKLEQNDLPLMLAGLDNLIPLYRDINSAPNLVMEFLPGNPNDHDEQWLHEKSWVLIEERLNLENRSLVTKFRDEFETPLTGSELEDILGAALNGRLETLFLVEEFDSWGVYDPIVGAAKMGENRNLPNVSLVNRLAIECILRDKKILVLPKGEMPFEFLQLGALYQY